MKNTLSAKSKTIFSLQQFLVLLIIISPLALNAKENSFYDFYGHHEWKGLHDEINAKYPLNFPKELVNEGNYKSLPDGYVQIFPVGPLDLWAFALPDKKFLVIYLVNKGGIAEKHKLQKWDEIIGVNGTLFTKAHDRNCQVGEDGPVKEFGEAINIAQGKGGLSLIIKRGKRKKKVKISVEKLGRFSPIYPGKCRKSELCINEVKEHVIADALNKLPKKFSSPVTKPLLGIGLLSSGDPNALPAIEKYVEESLTPKEQIEFNNPLRVSGYTVQEGLSCWHLGFRLFFFCEYFWATGDTRIFPAIQRMANSVSTEYRNPFGAFGHDKGGLGTYGAISFGPAGGICIAALAMAERCGAKVDHQTFLDYYNSLTGNTSRLISGESNRFEAGKAPYSFAVNYQHQLSRVTKNSIWNGSFNTATAALALQLMPEVEDSKKIAEGLINFLKNNPHSTTYVHSAPVLGQFWSTLALATNGAAMRKQLEYRIFEMSLSRFPDKTWQYFYSKISGVFDRGGGFDGDLWSGLDGVTSSKNLILLTATRKRLLAHGNKKRNWLAPKVSVKSTYRYITKYHGFYMAKIFEQAQKHIAKKNYLAAYEIYTDLTKLYENKKSVKSIKLNLSRLYRHAPAKKLKYLAEMAEAQNHLDYLEKHKRAGLSRINMLKYVAKKYSHLKKIGPKVAKLEELIKQQAQSTN